MKSLFRLLTLGAFVAVSAQMTGCAQLTMTPTQATVENTAKLRSAGLAPTSMGDFKLDASKPASLDKSISVRGANTMSPPSGSFAAYLGETLKAELAAANLLNPKSDTVVSGFLTESELDAAIGTGKGSLGARFVVTRAGSVRFDRTLRVDSSWESSFMGAVAIPAALHNYQGMYRKLVDTLIEDPTFRQALSK